jgi:hypothetical protein
VKTTTYARFSSGIALIDARSGQVGNQNGYGNGLKGGYSGTPSALAAGWEING